MLGSPLACVSCLNQKNKRNSDALNTDEIRILGRTITRLAWQALYYLASFYIVRPSLACTSSIYLTPLLRNNKTFERLRGENETASSDLKTTDSPPIDTSVLVLDNYSSAERSRVS